ncbi:HD domain-containing protein [Streptomyces aureoverticillatus]|nr:HD domain-containing protein [Streptomyces aureoverticillatus]
MILMTLAEVEAVAREAHATQTDKTGRPYVEHLEAVAGGVRERGGSAEQIAAAWLHDALEDGALTPAWLDGAALSPLTKAIVLALTKHEGESPESYAQRLRATPGAVLVKQSDLAHNADPRRLAELDEPTRARLTAKYAHMRSLLAAP